MNYITLKADMTRLRGLRYWEDESPLCIRQNVELIMATNKGTVPLCMDFGVDQSYIDYPVPEAQIRMIAPLREAIEQWEERVTVQRIYNNPQNEPSRLRPVAEVVINASES